MAQSEPIFDAAICISPETIERYLLPYMTFGDSRVTMSNYKLNACDHRESKSIIVKRAGSAKGVELSCTPDGKIFVVTSSVEKDEVLLNILITVLNEAASSSDERVPLQRDGKHALIVLKEHETIGKYELKRRFWVVVFNYLFEASWDKMEGFEWMNES